MKRHTWLLVFLVPIAIAAVITACGGSPTSPSFGPSPGGGNFPSPGGGNFPSPGGGNHPSPGLPTPKPTPTPPPPTPTPTPTVPCPPTLTLDAVGTPTFLSAAINNNSLFPLISTNYGLDCVVKDVKISLHLTTTTGFVPTPTDFTSPGLNVGVCGSGVGFTGCSQSVTYLFQSTASGNQLGTTCPGDFVFDTASTTVFDGTAPPPAPYSGTYQWDPGRTGVGDLWHLKDLQYSFVNTSPRPPDTVLECATIDITTQIVP